MKSTKLFMLTLIIWGSAGLLSAQTVTIKNADGSENIKTISTIQKVTFLSNSLILQLTDGTSQSLALTGIRKIYFYERTNDNGNTTTLTSTHTKGMASVFPNPASDYIQLKNVTTPISIAIYRMDGTLVFKSLYTSTDEQINVSRLAYGFYVLKVNNQVLKFIKL